MKKVYSISILYFDIGRGNIRSDTKAPGLEQARRKLIYYNMDRAEQLAYDEHINAVMIQNARTMKSLNISTDVIHQVTGLSIEEINRL